MNNSAKPRLLKNSIIVTLIVIIIFLAIVYFSPVIEKLRISKLDYNFEILVPEGVTEQEWLDSTLFYYEEDEDDITGQDYYERSKMYALDIVGELRDHNPFNYYSGYSDFRHTKRLLTQIFELQCEFDFINNGFYTYLEIDSTIEWRTFFEKELKKRNKDFKVLDRDFFNVIFSRVYDSK